MSSATGESLHSNYLLRSYDAWVGGRSSTLHPPGWWREALDACAEPLIFLLKSHYGAERSLLQAAGLPLLYEDGQLLAMGPCRGPGTGEDRR